MPHGINKPLESLKNRVSLGPHMNSYIYTQSTLSTTSQDSPWMSDEKTDIETV